MKLVLPQSYALSISTKKYPQGFLVVSVLLAAIALVLLIQFLPDFLETFCIKVSLGDTVY
jgi:hypothetical protein